MQKLPTTMTTEEQLLLEGLKKGQTKSFDALFHKYYQCMVNQAYLRIGDISDSEDMVQDIFVALWQKRDSVSITSNLAGYLMTAVKYKVYRYIDRQRLKSNFLPENEPISFETGDVLAFEELYEQLSLALEKLPAKEKEIFTLSRFHFMKTDEISEKLKLAPQTVHNKMHFVLKFLRAELKHYFFATLLISVSIFLFLKDFHS